MDPFEEFYIKAAKFLSVRPRSEKEVRDNLVKKNAPEAVVEKVIEKLKSQKFLDDTEFARWWVKQRTTFRPKSYYIIKSELHQKGISQDVVELVLSDDNEERVDEETLAKQVAQKHIRKYRGLSKQEIYTKLGALLSRRGFSFGVSKRVIDDILK